MRDLETIAELFGEAAERGTEFHQGVQIIKRAPRGVSVDETETFDLQPLWKRAMVMRELKRRAVNVLEVRQYLRREYQRAYRRRIREEIRLIRASRTAAAAQLERLCDTRSSTKRSL